MSRNAGQNVRRPVISLLAAIGASTLCLGVAAAPARAAETEQAKWARLVSDSLRHRLRAMPGVPPAVRFGKAAIVGAHFDADGQLHATSLDSPTGNRVLDAEALRAVNQVAFPRLPASMRGRPRMIPVEVFFTTPDANPGHREVRRQALDLAAGARRFYAEVPAGQPTS